ncbi:unnamed protein product [Parnassius mnemosyne]|uniref:DNA-directed RNA polymerase I subunit RPA34 n=1 Tax=Parnassius mnemosyne TaxID=213953 RepID=A0AAV1M7R5_9NEOP
MDSSDDNFVWSDASSNNDTKMDLNIKEHNYDDESESGYSYKKKIQKELFNIQHENSGLETNNSKKSKKRKNMDLDSSYKEESNCKHIKTEPESDLDVRRKKKKRKISVSNNTVQDEEFLNLKVKEEQSPIEEQSPKLKSKKKKKHKESIHESLDTHDGQSESFTNSTLQCENSENISNVKEELQDTEINRTKKKKAKKKKEKIDSEDMIVEEKFSAEETVVEERVPNGHISGNNITDNQDTVKENNDNLKNNSVLYESNEQSLVDVNEDVISNIDSSKTKKKNNSVLGNVTFNDEIILSSSSISNKVTPRASKISDRIRFEDEDSLDLHSQDLSNRKSSIAHSTQLQSYIKINPHLNRISPNFQSDSIISQDDEVWVLKCPHEIDVKNLKDTSILLDNKCKFKVDSQTYVGLVENSSDRVAILTVDKNVPVIKNIPLSGTVNFHKRIPKAHFIEDNTMVNNQTNFIPLPEIKCRHPLFGANYKHAIKLPKHIIQRLNPSEVESIPTSNEKRKKKMKKNKKENLSDNEQESKPDPETLEVPHKKRKRKLSQEGETSPKLIKRLKHDPDSDENGESEKAIEKQLFSF